MNIAVNGDIVKLPMKKGSFMPHKCTKCGVGLAGVNGGLLVLLFTFYDKFTVLHHFLKENYSYLLHIVYSASYQTINCL